MTDPQSDPGKEESNVDPAVVRWIPYVPLGAVLIALGTYVIYAAVLMQAG